MRYFHFNFVFITCREMQQRSMRLQNHKPFNSQLMRTNTYPKRLNIPQTIAGEQADEVFGTPQGIISPRLDETRFYTPKLLYTKQMSSLSTGSSGTEEYGTPDSTVNHFHKLEKSKSTNQVQLRHCRDDLSVLRSQSEFLIPRKLSPQPTSSLSQMFFNSESLFSFLTPRPKRREIGTQSTPICAKTAAAALKRLPETRTTSLSSLEMEMSNNNGLFKGKRYAYAGRGRV